MKASTEKEKITLLTKFYHAGISIDVDAHFLSLKFASIYNRKPAARIFPDWISPFISVFWDKNGIVNTSVKLLVTSQKFYVL